MKTQYNYISNNTIGINWLKQGWGIFKNNPITWLFIIIATVIIIGLLNNFTIGRFIGVVVTPLLFGGIYMTLDKSHQGQDIGFMGLFSAFKTDHARKQLFIIGLMGLTIIALIFIFKNMPGSNLPVFSGKEHSISYRELGSLGSILSALVSYIWAIALSLSVPLVCLQKLPAIVALKLSIKAVFANIKPLTIYFLMVIVLIIIVIIPFGLGLFIAMPVIFYANYALYDSLFNTNTQDRTSLDKTTLDKTLQDYKKR